MIPSDRFGWIVSLALSSSGLLATSLIIVFLGVYTVRYPWEKSGAGRALVAGGSGVLIESIGDLARWVGQSEAGDVLTAVGNLWLSTILIIGVVLVIKGETSPFGGHVATKDTPAHLEGKP